MPGRKRSPVSVSKRAAVGPSPEKLMEGLKQFVRARGAEFLRDKNISSVGVGYKVKDGKPTKEISIQFTVKQKALPEALESVGTEMIPSSFTIEGVEVPTDVLQRTFRPSYRPVVEAAAPDRKSRIDPIVPGVSVAHKNVSAGTIGCIVYDGRDGTPYILSNWHVLHGPSGNLGDTVVQPGPHDDNRVSLNRLGRLVRSHLGAAGDCAVATIEDRGFKPDILELDVSVEQIGEPELGDKVVKSGRTTAVTHGVVRRVHTVARIDYGGSAGERTVGGFEIGPDPDQPATGGEISMGGDSGSAWLFKGADGTPTKTLAGLHFAGEGTGDPDEHALACYAKSVFKKLEIALKPPKPEEVRKPKGQGYNPDFLKFHVPLPALTAATEGDAFKQNGSEVIDYTHFSLSLSRSRRFAVWVAWNVDGGALRKLSRKGLDFVLDPNVPAEVQVGNEIYEGNRLDRGHIARRADLLWGGLTEARRANKESFFYTNITPQMDDFNQSAKQGVWGQLEDAVFNDVDVEDMRISVLGGPAFRPDDREFRDVRIPREFWKVLAYIEAGKLKTKAFLLTQNLDQLEALELDEFRVFQVTLSEVEQRCGIRFADELRAADGFAEGLARRPERLEARRPLSAATDIEW